MANRKKQIAAIQARAGEFAGDIEAIRDDMQESFDNLPESLQEGDRAQVMQDRIDLLDAWCTELETIATEEIE